MKKKRPKKPDIYEQQKQAYWRAHDMELPLRERFSSLASLSVHMDFEEPDWGGNPKPMERHFSPGDKAFFKVACPYRECVNGGFDFSDAVSNLVKDRLIEASGTITCQGWQDRERLGRHRCLLKVIYRLVADYVLDT